MQPNPYKQPYFVTSMNNERSMSTVNQRATSCASFSLDISHVFSLFNVSEFTTHYRVSLALKWSGMLSRNSIRKGKESLERDRIIRKGWWMTEECVGWLYVLYVTYVHM